MTSTPFIISTMEVHYHATPLEQAYAGYLMHQLTGSAHYSDTEFRLSGRTAVPFLQSSNLPRLLLREFWSVADPSQQGTLMEWHQWHTLLRLVALAQQNHINFGGGALPSQDSLRETLSHTQIYYTHLPLAKFEHITIPSPDSMLAQYAHCIVATKPVLPEATHVSVSDAFGELLPDTIDAPLPVLPTPADQENELKEEDADEEEDDDFGDFDEAPATTNEEESSEPALMEELPASNETSQQAEQQATVQPSSTDSVQMTGGDLMQDITARGELAPPSAPELNTAIDDDDPFSSAFDAIAPLEDQPLPTLQAVSSTDAMDNIEIQADVSEEDDGFGDFADAAEGGGDSQVAAASPVDTLSAFDTIAPAEDKPLPDLGVTDMMEIGEEISEELKPGSIDTIDPLSAFDALAPSEDKPLPEPGALAENTEPEFKDEPAVLKDIPPSDRIEETPETQTFQQETADPFSSAFDAIAPLQDQALPPLGSVSVDAEDETDDFGDFISQEAEHLDHSEIEPTQTTELGTATTEVDPFSSAFHEVENQPLPPLGSLSVSQGKQEKEEEEEDDFGDFDGPATHEETTLQLGEDAMASEGEGGYAEKPGDEMAKVADGDDEGISSDKPGTSAESLPESTDEDPFAAFDAMSAPQPELPPLASIGSLPSADGSQSGSLATGMQREVSPPHGDEMDGFGEFDGPSDQSEPTAALEDEKEDSETMAKGMPDLGNEHRDITNDLLGASSGASLPEPIEDDPFAAFDTMTTPQPELPPLSSVESIPSGDGPQLEAGAGEQKDKYPFKEEDDDEFGVFEENTPEPTVDSNMPVEGFHQLGLAAEEETRTKSDEDEGDDFGGFESVSAEANPEPQIETTDATKELGLAAEEETQTKPDAPQSGDEDKDEDDDFGGFESISVEPNPEPQIETTDASKELGLAATEEESQAKPDAPQSNDEDEDEDDDFGGFESVSVEPNPEPQIETKDAAVFEGFENISAVESCSEPEPVPATTEDDDFGDFSEFTSTSSLPQPEAAQEELPSEPAAAESIAVHEAPRGLDAAAEVDDSFTAFASGAGTANHDDWGAFEEPIADEAPSEQQAVTSEPEASFEVEFDAFAGAPEPDVPEVPNISQNQNDAWGSFEAGPTAENDSLETMEQVRKRIDELSGSLPETFFATTKNSNIDLTTTFEINIEGKQKGSGWRRGFKSPKVPAVTTEVQLEQGRRACEVLTLLTSTHSHLVSSAWSSSLSTIRDELATGSFLLEEAKGLDKSVQREVSDSLQVFVLGLGEYVRVARSITTTVGDLLGLDMSVEFDRKGWSSSWSSLSLLEPAVEIEESWSMVQKLAGELDCVKELHVDSVSEIRSQCLALGSGRELCRLTLQRLAQNDTHGSTKTQVQWESKVFMACAANFYANRVSTVAP